jgi:oxygen-dependent protoporphyrinogen oxidase
MIATVRKDGFLYETGPQFPRFPAAAWRLVRDLNLESELLRGDSKVKRYIVRRGTLHRAPFSPQGLLSTSLVSARSKWRIITEVFRTSQPPKQEETLAGFVQRKFGSEILDSLVDPIVSSVFMGDPQKMGMESAFPALVEWERKHGSLVRGAIRARDRKSKRPALTVSSTQHSKENSGRLRVTDALPTLGTFHDGMARLPEQLAAELSQNIRYNSGISGIEYFVSTPTKSPPSWEIRLSSGERIACESLVLAVPAYVAADILTDAAPQISARLGAIDYSPMSVFSFVYDRSAVAHPLDGFGFMVPRKEALNTVCTFWNSSLFPHRAPEGKVLITSFANTVENAGAKNSATPIDRDALASSVEQENVRLLGIRKPPLDCHAWSSCRAMPQYNVGHAQRVAEIERLLQDLPTLHLAGNYLKGRAIGDCVDVAVRVAEKLCHYSRGNPAQADCLREPSL